MYIITKILILPNIIINLYIFILINLGVGIMMIRANIQYVKSLDELQRLIALQAMGIALGVAVVGGITYSARTTPSASKLFLTVRRRGC